jgi:hypothetical protein
MTLTNRLALIALTGACVGASLACTSSSAESGSDAAAASEDASWLDGSADAGEEGTGESGIDAAVKKESECGTTVPPAAAIVDSNLDVWTLTSGGQIARNGIVDTVTNGVVLLLYFKGVVYQEAHALWWAWKGGGWQDAADPRVGGSCMGDSGIDGSVSPGSLTYMIGYGGGAMSDSQVAAAEVFTGRPMDIGSDGITVDGFQFPAYTSSNGRKLGKIIMFEMLSASYDSNKSLNDMNQAASGAYDATYAQMAQAMANSVEPIVSCRIGWEMNGDWYPWSAYNGNAANATPANYIATFQRIARIVRQYNPDTLIEWCPNYSANPTSAADTSATALDY